LASEVPDVEVLEVELLAVDADTVVADDTAVFVVAEVAVDAVDVPHETSAPASAAKVVRRAGRVRIERDMRPR
jgi:hypothetical protein